MQKPCPLCESTKTQEIIQIHRFPVFSNVLWPDRAAARNVARGDIDLFYCKNCGHIYNQAFDAGKLAYSQDYENSLDFSPRFREYIQSLAVRLVETYDLKQKDIMEIGCGQGDFLNRICRLGGNRGIGFDPSYQPVENGRQGDRGHRQAGVTIIQDLFSEAYLDTPLDFLISRQVFEHIEEPAQFLAMLRRAVADRPDAVIFFEVPNVLYTLERQGIWDILYEHCSYFSAQSLAYAFERSGFQVLALHETFGEQFLTIEAAPRRSLGSTSYRPDALAHLEQAVESFSGLYRSKVQTWQDNLRRFRDAQQRAVVWGAGTKGISFLNTLDSGGVIDYVVDINPRKIGMYITGAGQEIVSPEFLQSYQPDVVIVMNPNYIEEIQSQLKELGVLGQVVLA